MIQGHVVSMAVHLSLTNRGRMEYMVTHSLLLTLRIAR